MQRATRLLAECGDVPRGIASCAVDADDPGIAEVFGLWVDPATRQAGVAWSLMEAVTQLAATQNRSQLYYWVGTENTRAIAFASNFGFRPSPDRRQARLARAGLGSMEMAMVLPVGSDPAEVPNPTMSSFGSHSGHSD
jgi:RimJ/RimL family protein N-acetyltransferase